ncbi:unnamed protein product [Prorocentrum cordatum]|uniref:Uncharacterized protein n=1 Tax=Prorocentrum cordatum TaxID=2364126 RepID=A0ABN9PDI8_9DINO|nr:unnamed protein product [Polarella glacialis]
MRALSELQYALEDLTAPGAAAQRGRAEGAGPAGAGGLGEAAGGVPGADPGELEVRAASAEASLLGARAESERLGEVAQGLEAELEEAFNSRDAVGEKLADMTFQADEWRREVEELTEQLAVVSDERDAARSQHEDDLFNRVAASDDDLVKAHSAYVDLTQRLQELPCPRRGRIWNSKEQELACQSNDLLMEEWQSSRTERWSVSARRTSS